MAFKAGFSLLQRLTESLACGIVGKRFSALSMPPTGSTALRLVVLELSASLSEENLSNNGRVGHLSFQQLEVLPRRPRSHQPSSSLPPPLRFHPELLWSGSSHVPYSVAPPLRQPCARPCFALFTTHPHIAILNEGSVRESFPFCHSDLRARRFPNQLSRY